MKLYLHTRPGPYLYISTDAEIAKSQPDIYLEDLSKGCDFRHPTDGKYMASTGAKKNQEDLDGLVNDLMDRLPGEDLDKDDDE